MSHAYSPAVLACVHVDLHAVLYVPQVFDSTRTRDLAVLCVRAFAGPECPAHVNEGDFEEGSAGLTDDSSSRIQGNGGSRWADDGISVQAVEASPSGFAVEPFGRSEDVSGGIEGVSWSDDDKAEKDSDGEECGSRH